MPPANPGAQSPPAATAATVSVCIPTRNNARFLPEALASALQQRGAELEIIVIDNCSTDGTEELVRTLQAQHPQVVFRRNGSDLGLAGNFNQCLKHAHGDFITILCADDFLLPGFVERMAACLAAHPSATMAAAARSIVNEHGQRLSARRYAPTDRLVAGRRAVHRCLVGGNFIGEPSAVMFRRQSAARGFSDDFPHLTDLEMWLHLLAQGDLVTVAAPLCAIRQHPGQVTFDNIRSGALMEDNVRLLEKYRASIDLPWTTRDRFVNRWMMTWRLWLSGRYLPPARRELLLERYGIRLGYPLMPLAAALVEVLRAVRRRFRDQNSSKLPS